MLTTDLSFAGIVVKLSPDDTIATHMKSFTVARRSLFVKANLKMASLGAAAGVSLALQTSRGICKAISARFVLNQIWMSL